MAQKRKDKAKKRVVQVEAIGQAHIKASFNNIIISITNLQGQVISWASAGKMGFKGSKKNTPYAAQMAAQNCAQTAYDLGLRKVEVFVKGPGSLVIAKHCKRKLTLLVNMGEVEEKNNLNMQSS